MIRATRPTLQGRILDVIRLDPRKPPPADYYRDNLDAVITFLGHHHPQVFAAQERDWLEAWRSTGTPAQRLYVRLLMRRGPWLRTDKLVYAEVGDVTAALAELECAGLIELNGEAPADALLDLYTIEELGGRFPACARRFRPRRKPEWVATLLSAHTDANLREVLRRDSGWVRLRALATLDRLKLLYFGSPEQDLSAFVLRDLGVVRYEAYAIEADQSVLAQPGVLERYADICASARWFDHLDAVHGLAQVLRRRLSEPVCLRAGERRRSRLLNELGRWHERRGEVDDALDCYAASTRHPARERQVRLLRAGGRDGEARTLVEAMAGSPWCVEEEVLAARLRLGRHPSPPHVHERFLPMPVERWTPGVIERCALQMLAAEGAWGLHLENVLPMMIAGLACWNVVFAPVSGAFTHPFQSAPHDLWWDDFASLRTAPVERALASLTDARDAAALLLEVWDQKVGMACDMVHWRAISRDDLERVLRAMPKSMIVDLVGIVINCPGRCRTGFPDLFVVHADGRCEFVEVKGPNDQLQPQQRVWLQRLARHGIAASVLRLRQPQERACAGEL